MTTSIYQSARSSLEARFTLFLENAYSKHGTRYDYSKSIFKSTKERMEIECPEHGSFWQTPSGHIKTSGCLKCSHEEKGKSSRKSTEEFIQEAEMIHGKKFIYTLTEYKTRTDDVIIECPEHGPFQQEARQHLIGKGGCLPCSLKNRDVGLWNMTPEHPRANDICYLYIIKLSGNGEEFYKYGISKDYNMRHRKIQYATGYNIELLDVIVDTRISCAKMEGKLKKLHKRKNKYIPLIKFGGYTECYTI